jgi:TonB family protein
MVSAVVAQEKPLADQKSDVKRCTPKVVSHASPPKQESIHIRPGEKSTGFSPIIAFQILETGEVTQAHIKRSSGIAYIDIRALKWIRGTKYNPRSGCGVIESEASISIDWVSGD